MKVKLLCDPYTSWENTTGAIIDAVIGDGGGVYGSIADACEHGATDAGEGVFNFGYRFLLPHEFVVIKE